MHKILLSNFLLLLFISCGSNGNKSEQADGRESLSAEELEGAKYIRDYFKGMTVLSATDFKDIQSADLTAFVANEDTLLFESLNFDWPKQFHESMISPYYETPADMKGHTLFSNSELMRALRYYLQTDQEMEAYTHDKNGKDVYLIDKELNAIGKITVEATSGDEIEYSTPNYDQDLHMSSSLNVDLDKQFIKAATLKIQELLQTEQVVLFNN